MPFDMVSLEMLHYIIAIAALVRASSFQSVCSSPSIVKTVFIFPSVLGSFKYTKGYAPWAKIPALRRHRKSGKHQWLCWNTERINVTSSPLLKSRTNSGIPNIVTSFDFSVLCLMCYLCDGELYMTITDIAQCGILDTFWNM